MFSGTVITLNNTLLRLSDVWTLSVDRLLANISSTNTSTSTTGFVLIWLNEVN